MGGPLLTRYDVCNGDADGLCALVQWRLSRPEPSTLVTGLKRDIALLQRVPARAGDEVLVLDVALQRNRAALLRLLALGVHVHYVDHHAVGEGVPPHPLLQAHIDLSHNTCTSLLVDTELGGAQRVWALVGAYGDNLAEVADGLAGAQGLDPGQAARLRWLGEALNYNAYGESLADVCVPPAQLYRHLLAHPDPLWLADHDPTMAQIDTQRLADLALAKACPCLLDDRHARALVLPDAPWSRRVQGCLANELANAQPAQAQAVLKPAGQGCLVVSVRAPLSNPEGADRLCRQFGGAGRARAAGIDALPQAELGRFVTALARMDWGAGSPPQAPV